MNKLGEIPIQHSAIILTGHRNRYVVLGVHSLVSLIPIEYIILTISLGNESTKTIKASLIDAPNSKFQRFYILALLLLKIIVF